jgi:uncharacterized membrane protein
MSDQIIDVTTESNGGPSPEGKSRAVIAHLTWIGWLIALIQNGGDKKDEFASFYVRQMLGLLILMIMGYILMFVLVGFIILIAVFVFWIMSIIAANNGEKKETPLVGKLFQDWFKNM